MECPKCGFEQDDNLVDCMRCGLVFSKYEALQKKNEKVQSQYSPGSPGHESPGEDDSAPADPNLAEEPEDARPPEISEKVYEQLEKIQVGIHSAITFQEGLFHKLANQQEQNRILLEHLDHVRQDMDHQILKIQTQIQPMVSTSQEIFKGLQKDNQLAEIRQDIRFLKEQLESISPSPKESIKLQTRLHQLETGYREFKETLRSLPGAGESGENTERALLQSEVRALRAEVRNLLEQSLTSSVGEIESARNGSLLSDLEDRIGRSIENLEDRISILERDPSKIPAESEEGENGNLKNGISSDELTSRQDRWSELASEIKKKMSELEGKQIDNDELSQKIQDFEKRAEVIDKLEKQLDSISTQLATVDQSDGGSGLYREELDQLRQSFDKFSDEIQKKFQTHDKKSREWKKNLEQQKDSVIELQSFFKKLKETLNGG